MKARFLHPKLLEKLANTDLDRYLWLTGKTILAHPLDPEEIFQVLFGLRTIYVNFYEEFSDINEQQKLGKLYPEKKLILINTGPVRPTENLIPETVQRFSLAHEGGHYSLHYVAEGCIPQLEFISVIVDRKRAKVYDYTEYDPLERQANYYAGALLIPKRVIKEVISSEKSLDLKKWGPILCNKFCVSRKSLEIRLSQLRIKYTNGIYDKY